MAKKGQQTKVPSSLFGACLNLLSAHLGGPLRLGGKCVVKSNNRSVAEDRRGTQRGFQK